jgi:hypothetical protein
MNRRELMARMLAMTAGTLASSVTTPLIAASAAAPATRRTRALAEYERLRLGDLTELHSRYRNTFYQLLDITWKISQEQRWEAVPAHKKFQSELHHRDEPGFLSEPTQPRAHLRTGKLAY